MHQGEALLSEDPHSVAVDERLRPTKRKPAKVELRKDKELTFHILQLGVKSRGLAAAAVDILRESSELIDKGANVVDALQAHALQQRSAHLISRCKISSRQVCDRALAGSIHQSSPFASHSLGDQKAGGS